MSNTAYPVSPKTDTDPKNVDLKKIGAIPCIHFSANPYL